MSGQQETVTGVRGNGDGSSYCSQCPEGQEPDGIDGPLNRLTKCKRQRDAARSDGPWSRVDAWRDDVMRSAKPCGGRSLCRLCRVDGGARPCRKLPPRAAPCRCTAGDGALPAACRRQLHIPKLWGFAPAVVVTMASWCGPSPGEGLVRVVHLMLAHGRVVVTMRHGWNGDDAVSPQNGTDGVPRRLTIR